MSIRNRAREACRSSQGCGFTGDVEGVASNVSQYNIWDEYLTQVSGLTSCYLRRDLVAGDGRLGAIYGHTVADVERILFGDDADLEAIFPRSSLGDLKELRHYYHPPAMGKCFPDYPRVEFMAGAVARNGDNFALLANTRIEVGEKAEGGYLFKDVVVRDEGGRDVVQVLDHYPGFVVDGRKVTLRGRRGLPAIWDSPQLQVRHGRPPSQGAGLVELGRCTRDPLQGRGPRRAVPARSERS